MSDIIERMKLAWEFGNGTWTLSDEAGAHIGFVQVTEAGAFKANYQGRWLSASTWQEFVHFEDLDEAKKALQAEYLERRSAR